ncbi:1489_t:CDS:2 [Ambispora gerdemannii]|uniref:1489_t:CDS:1 n=1 Tax=Ambispora gerdemannii TaxID=144530 RepID=A0A9N9GQP5_9GLOM|nr:1489_t:CDS:2 [Ambispora gerdemannii]
MATEEVPEVSSITSKSDADAEVFQLEALSLNYLRSQNISVIPDDDHIPKLRPCKLCNKAIFGFRLEAFTALHCGHLFHRICLEIHIIRGATKYPTCPTCGIAIEIFREESALASGKCGVMPKEKASQQSNVTIDDDEGELEFMQEIGLMERDASSVSAEKTKQVIMEDQATSLIANNSISTQEQATSPISNMRNVTVDAQTRTSRQASPKITREQEKLQGLLHELSTPIKGETDEDGNESSENSMSQSLARLYQKASLAKKPPLEQP